MGIKFEDIKRGDYIEVAWSVGDREKVYRGVVDYISAHGTWCTEEGMPIVAQRDGGTITLLHRPAPAEPTGLGAVVRARVAGSPSDAEAVQTLVRTPYTDLPWIDEIGDLWHWSHLDPDSIEKLSEGIEVES